MRAWKWIVLVGFFFVWFIWRSDHAMAGIAHPDLKPSATGAFFLRGVGTRVNRCREPDREFVLDGKNVGPLDSQVKCDFVAGLKDPFFMLAFIILNREARVPEKIKRFLGGAAGDNRLTLNHPLVGLEPRLSAWHRTHSADHRYGHISRYRDITRRGLARIADHENRRDVVFAKVVFCGFAVEVRPNLGFTQIARHCDCFLSGFGSVLGLVNGTAGVLGGIAGVEQSAPDQDDTNGGEKDSSTAGNEHPKSPPRHVLLGLQVGYFALALPFTLYLIFLGYQIANSGFDALDRGQKLRGVVLFWSGILFACAAATFLPYGGYWLAFEGGLLRFLS
jgi:hypothetical protein